MSSFRFKSFTKPKKSAISKTSEREFDREVKKLETLDESTKKIQEDMKRCIKSQTAQAKFETDIVQNMQNNALSREDEKLREICDHWSQSVKQLELQMEELNATSRRSIVDPMKKFSTIFPSVQQATRKREQSLQEYTNRQEKVEKYLKRERTGPNVVKLENSRKACAIAKMDFDSQNSILMEEVPRLYEGRIAYFQPSLQALIKAQIKYYTDSQDTYSKLCKQLNSSSSSPTQDPVQLRQNIQQKLTEIRALSIAVDDQAK